MRMKEHMGRFPPADLEALKALAGRGSVGRVLREATTAWLDAHLWAIEREGEVVAMESVYHARIAAQNQGGKLAEWPRTPGEHATALNHARMATS